MANNLFSKAEINALKNDIAGDMKSYAEQIQQNSEDISSLRSEIADVNNNTETPAGAGKIWTTTESGAEWREPTGGTAGAFELLVSQELAETVINISFDLGKTVNEIYMVCESPKVTNISTCTWRNETGTNIGFWPTSVLSANSQRWVMTHFYKIDNVKVVCDTRYGSNKQTASSISMSYYDDFNDGISRLTCTYATGLAAGTKFTIWGC